MQLGSLQYPHNPMKGASEHPRWLPAPQLQGDLAWFTFKALDALWHRCLRA